MSILTRHTRPNAEEGSHHACRCLLTGTETRPKGNVPGKSARSSFKTCGHGSSCTNGGPCCRGPSKNMFAKSYERIAQSEIPPNFGSRISQRLSVRRHAVIFVVLFSVVLFAAISSVKSNTMSPNKEETDNDENFENALHDRITNNYGETADGFEGESLNDHPLPNDDGNFTYPGADESVQEEEKMGQKQIEPIHDTVNDDKNTLVHSSGNAENVTREFINQHSRLTDRCASKWSPEFSRRYLSECPYWLTSFIRWENALVRNSQVVGYLCGNVGSCRGWGDRTGGILNAFMKAMQDKSKLRVGHPGLSILFNPCLFNRESNWAAKGVPVFKEREGTCMTTPLMHCSGWLDMTCPNLKPLATVNTDRVCIPNKFCIDLLKTGGGKLLNAASILGCPLRALLEPTVRMREGVRVPIRIAGENSPIVKMTVKEIENLFSNYFVISIHFRLGDLYAFSQGVNSLEHRIDLEEEQYSRPFHCANTVERYLVTNQKTNGKPVRWFLASDSYRLKLLAAKAFGEKVILIDQPPEHVAVDGSINVLSQTLAEWHLISLGDELIVNQMDAIVGNFYNGRVSAFAKTAWVYQLKHEVYDAGTCRRYSLPFEGIWSELKLRTCQRDSVSSKGFDVYKQEHLEVLEEAGLMFPHAYVSASTGEIILINSTFVPKSGRL